MTAQEQAVSDAERIFCLAVYAEEGLGKRQFILRWLFRMAMRVSYATLSAATRDTLVGGNAPVSRAMYLTVNNIELDPDPPESFEVGGVPGATFWRGEHL